jgi:hypothetical protein
MKKLLCSMGLVILLSPPNYAQTFPCLYFPLEPNRTWQYYSDTFPDPLIVDTTHINNRFYYSFAPYGPNPNWPRYWLRPDSNKIFALNIRDSSEYLLFDFEAELNQSWNIPPVLTPPSNLPLNQCDWGSSIAMISNTDTIVTSNRTFYSCRHFAHFNHPCYDAGIGITCFSRDFGMVSFSQYTEGGVIDWYLVTEVLDTTLLLGAYSIIGNPCTTIPCLPGVVSAVTSGDTNYVLTVHDIWFNGDFSWNNFTPVPGDSVLVRGIITVRTDLLYHRYFTLEVIDFAPYPPVTISDALREIKIPQAILLQNYPNPFNPQTRIEYRVTEPGNVKILVYDITGRKINTILNEFKTIGNYHIMVDGSDLSSGLYYYRLITAAGSDTKSMTYIK